VASLLPVTCDLNRSQLLPPQRGGSLRGRENGEVEKEEMLKEKQKDELG
jgi:hypothetical protein